MGTRTATGPRRSALGVRSALAARAGLAGRAALAGLLSMTVLAPPLTAQEEVRRSLAVDGAPYVRVMVFAGSVAVRGWDADTIAVTGTVDRDGRFYLAGAGNSAKLGVWPEGRSDTPLGELEVRVPRGSTVWVKTESAHVRVEGVEGGVDVYSVTGAVRITGTPRTVNAESMGGAVEIDASAPTVRARTAAGSVTFRGRAAEATLSTVAGRIDVEGAPMDRGRFETVTGDIRFAAGVRRGGRLDFRTHSGRVELLLPPETGADFLVRTVEGRLENALPGVDGASLPAPPGRELAFVTAAGGASVDVHTYSGDVRLAAR